MCCILPLWLPLSAVANPYRTVSTTGPVVLEGPSLQSTVKPLNLTEGERTALELRLKIPEGAQVYRDQLTVWISGPPDLEWADPVYPAGRVDSTGRAGSAQREWYEHDVVIDIPLVRAGLGLRQATVFERHQVCRGGICFPPQQTMHVVYINVEEKTPGAVDASNP